MSNLLSSRGHLIVSPESRLNAKKRPGENWAIVNVHPSIAYFYREQLIRNLLHPPWLSESRTVHGPRWSPHITFMDNRIKLDGFQKSVLRQHHGEIIEFEYDINPYKHWKFWALRVHSPRLDYIRRRMQLPGKYPYHITIAREE